MQESKRSSVLFKNEKPQKGSRGIVVLLIHDKLKDHVL